MMKVILDCQNENNNHIEFVRNTTSVYIEIHRGTQKLEVLIDKADFVKLAKLFEG
jgi:hypothetical protein